MKKFVTPSPIPNGGMPIFGDDFIDCVQTDIYRAIIAGYKQYAQPVILHGCEVVADTGAGTCTIAAGMAFLNGDLIDTPAYTGAYPAYLVEADSTTILKAYKDQEVRPVTVQKNAVYLGAEPADGEFIFFDPYTSQYLKDVRRRTDTPIGRCEWFSNYPNPAAFDVNGLGKWEWLGYAVANGGTSGTVDATGRVFAQFNPADPDFAIGNPYGSKQQGLTVGQLPEFSIIYKRPSLNIVGTLYETLHVEVKGSGGRDLYTGYNVTSPPIGNNELHNNVQETLSGVVIQRIL